MHFYVCGNPYFYLPESWISIQRFLGYQFPSRGGIDASLRHQWVVHKILPHLSWFGMRICHYPTNATQHSEPHCIDCIMDYMITLDKYCCSGHHFPTCHSGSGWLTSAANSSKSMWPGAITIVPALNLISIIDMHRLLVSWQVWFLTLVFDIVHTVEQSIMSKVTRQMLGMS